MDLGQLWSEFPADWHDYLLRIALAVLVVLLIWVLRKLLAAIVVAPLRRVARRSSRNFDETVLDAVIVPARLLIVAAGLALGAQILRVDIETNLFVEHLIRTLVIIAVMIAGYRVVDALAPSSNRLFRFTGLTVSERLLPFIRTAAKFVLAAIALVIVIQEWGYDVSGLVAGLGIGGLAISLAAQDTVANLFGFTTIVGDQPFMVGEFIKTPDVEGTVEHVGVRSTRVRQPDQAYVSVPNSKLASSVILNWSRLSKRWINTHLYIRYDASPTNIEELLKRIRTLLSGRDLVESDTIVVRLVEFGEYGLQILVRCYVKLPNWGEFTAEKEAVYIEILKIIEELGLHIAFPSRSVYIESRAFTDIQEEKDE